jgi:hypothetical protein
LCHICRRMTRYQAVHNGRGSTISSLDRQLDVFKTIIGSSVEDLAREQAQDDEEDEVVR